MRFSHPSSFTGRAIDLPLSTVLTGLLLCAELARGAEPVNPNRSAPGDKPAATNSIDKAADWKPLFDGKTLRGWKVTDFAGHGEVTVEPNIRSDPKTAGAPAMVFDMGAVLTGVT